MKLIKLSSFLDITRGQVNRTGLKGELDGCCKGVYSFFWTGNNADIPEKRMSAMYKGKKGTDPIHLPWKFSEDVHQCLYVGKTGDFPYRLGLHIKAGTTSENWYNLKEGGLADQSSIHKPTTSCQLRSGIEHLFVENKMGLEYIRDHVSFCFEPIKDDVDRFYRECELIGKLRPWFNLDVER